MEAAVFCFATVEVMLVGEACYVSVDFFFNPPYACNVEETCYVSVYFFFNPP